MEQPDLRRRARASLRAGAERAGARAHFRAIGIDPSRLDGPIVGIVSTWTGTMPCNLNHRELADAVAAAVRRPAACRCRSTRSPSPTTSRRARRDARLADLARGDRRLDRADDARARLRRARLPRRLRQDDAGRADGARARRQAGVRALRRPDARRPAARARGHDPGRLGGRRRRGARAAHARGAGRARGGRLPRAGTCAGHFTANTMAVALDCLGLAASGDGLDPAEELDAKRAAAARAGATAVDSPSPGRPARRSSTGARS